MTIKKALISVVTAAAVVAGGSFAIAQTTGTQGPASDSPSAASPAPRGTGSGMGNNAGQVDSMGRTGTQSARMDRN